METGKWKLTNMQTFLCEMTFSLSVARLDNKRLGKQRVEAYQILLALGDKWAWSVYKGNKTRENYGWQNHPAVLMWKDHTTQLRLYYCECLDEWQRRGFVNNMPYADYDIPKKWLVYADAFNPFWYTEKFVTSHRCNLLRKDYGYYSQFNWNVPDNYNEIDYIWPVKKSVK